ncbi:ethanolamine ammonia-lyase light chain EutC, partial [Streptomyces lydicus]
MGSAGEQQLWRELPGGSGAVGSAGEQQLWRELPGGSEAVESAGEQQLPVWPDVVGSAAEKQFRPELRDRSGAAESAAEQQFWQELPGRSGVVGSAAEGQVWRELPDGLGATESAAEQQFWQELRRSTQSRIGLGRSGDALPTARVLEFRAAHSAARDAVHTPLNLDDLTSRVAALGLGDPVHVRSAARDRAEYLRRPDLGRIPGESAFLATSPSQPPHERAEGATGSGPQSTADSAPAAVASAQRSAVEV